MYRGASCWRFCKHFGLLLQISEKFLNHSVDFLNNMRFSTLSIVLASLKIIDILQGSKIRATIRYFFYLLIIQVIVLKFHFHMNSTAVTNNAFEICKNASYCCARKYET